MNKFLAGIISLFFTLNAHSEPTESQRKMMAEPATMMDLFLLHNTILLKEFNERGPIVFDPNSTHGFFPAVKTKSGKAVEKFGDIALRFDWDSGAFHIDYSFRAVDLDQQIQYDLINGKGNYKNACSVIIMSLKHAYLDTTYVNHHGFQNENYQVQSGSKDYNDSFINNVIINAKISIYAMDNGGSPYDVISCSIKSGDMYKGPKAVKHEYSGSWNGH